MFFKRARDSYVRSENWRVLTNVLANSSRLARKGGVQPIGSNRGNVNVGGRTWELWVGMNGAMKVFSFVAPSEIAVFEGDIKPFFDHVTNTQGFPASQQTLISMSLLYENFLLLIPKRYANVDSLAYQFGTEPFTGSSARFDVWYWYGEVN